MNTTSHGVTNWFVMRNRSHAGLAAIAGLMPDVPYVLGLFWGLAKYGFEIRAVGEIWSNPLLNFIAQRLLQSVVLATAFGIVALASRKLTLRAFAAGWALHVWIDHWLHARDAYPTLWPFTRRVFPSPISYWDWDFGGRWIGIVLSLWALALWAYLARRLWRGESGSALLVSRGRKTASVLAAIAALSCGPGIVFSLLGYGPTRSVQENWVRDGFHLWPPKTLPAVEAIERGDPATALALVEALPDGADAEAPEGTPFYDVPQPGARRALLKGYALDLLGRRAEALAAYREAERLETVGSLGDKARRYQGEVFRNEPDPIFTWEWIAIFAWGLALCAVLVRSVPYRNVGLST